ncbi:hypothetical protein JST97_30285 [bacterium]|nr:hypothetical protein [bacterium]
MWLSIVAYMIRAGVTLGLIETEPETAQRRAYIRAHDALHWLRSLLWDSQLQQVDEHQCRFLKSAQVHTISFEEGRLFLDRPRARQKQPIPLVFDPLLVDEVELGPDGSVRFAYSSGRLHIEVQAGDDSLGVLGVSRLAVDYMLHFDAGLTSL